jgi:hypothetical protein
MQLCFGNKERFKFFNYYISRWRRRRWRWISSDLLLKSWIIQEDQVEVEQ